MGYIDFREELLSKNLQCSRVVIHYNQFAFIFILFVALATSSLLPATAFCAGNSQAGVAAATQNIITNNVHMSNAPSWLSGSHMDRVVDSVQSKMEWDIRRISVTFYYDEPSFLKANQLGSSAVAITRRSDLSVHLGPEVKADNFDQVFAHELVHVISMQKYKGAIPNWLEEGLANHLSHYGAVDYNWLASQAPIGDVKELVHPFAGTVTRTRYIYMASTALAEKISAKCDFTELLRMSVKRKLENYLGNICDIHDLNGSFKNWVSSHGTTKAQ